MNICTTCREEKEAYHGKKCIDCRRKYCNEKWLRKNRKICPVCKSEHNMMTIECSTKCKILNRHVKKGECWEWTGKVSARGYGTFQEKINGKKKDCTAHRRSYEAFIGEIPKDLFVLHKCDNRKCCNPDHLFVGTHSDNMQDMLSKGRQNYPSGEQHYAKKLNNEDVFEIRKLDEKGFSHEEIGEKYGVNRATIWDIANKKTWCHI